MTEKRKSNNTRHSKHVVEARAGLIPASDDLAEEKRIRIGQITPVVRAWKAYAGSRAREDSAIIDILADLRLYCDCKGLAFGKLNTAAHARHLEEASESQ